MSSKNQDHYNVLVVGAGTSGMEAALSLGDMGYKVLMVEKEPSIGGKTILLSKVFPTLDCASCISTPKMAAAAHHPNVTLSVYSEIDQIDKSGDQFEIALHQKALNVQPAKCTGCGQCEEACTVAVPDEYNYNMVARRAAYIPFPQAIPKKAVIEKRGSAPCHNACPAGVHASGFVSLVRSGKYREAFLLHLEDAPLVGVLSRACYAPCERDCTRSELEGPVNIRAIKRFMADYYYTDHEEPEYGIPDKVLSTRVAIVGSGPAGLSAAFFLAREGHQVVIFEGENEAGGMLRYGLPSYRLPKNIVDRDIKNITALGVEIKTGIKIKSLQALRDQGFDGIVTAVGGQVPRVVPIEGIDLVNRDDCMSFLSQSQNKRAEIENKHVIVIGGGNVAIDVARSALRLNATTVTVLCLECKKDMPAHSFEIQEAQEEGISFYPASVTNRIYSNAEGTQLEFLEVESFKMVAGKPELKTVSGSEQQVRADVVIMAVGLAPSTAPFKSEMDLNPNQTIIVNEETLETSVSGIFACGDAVLGPDIIVKAVAQGKRVAHYLNLKLKGEPAVAASWMSLPAVVDSSQVLDEAKENSSRLPIAVLHKPPKQRVSSFEAYEGVFTEVEARAAANRCLDCAVCSQCLECVRVCPAEAVDFNMKTDHKKVTADAVILAAGFEIIDPEEKPLLGFGRYPNVISAPQMDRLLAPTRPFNSVLRPSDGKEPEKIAMVLCSGSRDHTVCNPLCCRIGCMAAIKQAQLMMGALPLADVTIYAIDIRAFGKGYEEFFEQARGMGVEFINGKVAKIEETETGNVKLYYEDITEGKGLSVAEYDMAVLSVGLKPNQEILGRMGNNQLEVDDLNYVKEADELGEPGMSTAEGIFVAGGFSEGRDIPDSVIHSAAAATQAARYISKKQKNKSGQKEIKS